MEPLSLEISFERHLETLDISAIAEWDVLVFLDHHGTTIASAAHLVRLIGYSQSVVESALENLTRAGLIQGSRGFDGIGRYQVIPLDTPARQDCLEALIEMADRRNGRLQLIAALRKADNSSRA
jgi:DNA-binding MarR family transcriptional regulator